MHNHLSAVMQLQQPKGHKRSERAEYFRVYTAHEINHLGGQLERSCLDREILAWKEDT
jgi:hypothetical protein